jgi:hypothetical protein
MSRDKINDLTAEHVRSVLNYDPETGIFRWKYNPDRRTEWNTRRAGQVAGGVTCGKFGRMHAVRIDGRLYLGHRLAWLYVHGEWPDEIDHINGEPADNRLKNLRSITHAQNSINRAMQSNNTNGMVGVRFREHHGKWEGRINLGGKTVWREYFDNPQEAAAARRIAVEEIYGDFRPARPTRRTKYVPKKVHREPSSE